MHKAKSDYFSSRTAQSNCCKELFSVVTNFGAVTLTTDTTLHLLHCLYYDLPLPTAFPICDCDLPDAFAHCCVRKVKTVGDELDSQMPVTVLPTDDPYSQSSFLFFIPVSMQICAKKKKKKKKKKPINNKQKHKENNNKKLAGSIPLRLSFLFKRIVVCGHL